MWVDPIVAEVRRVRDELSARFNYDVDAILADIRRRQAALGDRLVDRSAAVANDQAAVPESTPANGTPVL
jgi:hypothetical protein